MPKIGFKPKSVTKEFVKVLSDRSQDIVTKRFGLNGGKSMTLESIGEEYGITRERVRQIENQAIKRLRKSPIIEEHQEVFSDLHGVMENLGHLVPEDDLLEHLTRDSSRREEERSHHYFILMVGEDFVREKSNTKLHNRWHVSEKVSSAVHGAIDKIKGVLTEKELVPEDKLLDLFRDYLGTEVEDRYREDEDVLKRWLRMSKEIDVNPLGEWGPVSSSVVRLKGMRDYAYLVLKKNGGPMHFSEVTRRIADLFGRDAHQATTHNELIRDPRFVLVGRGLYALKEWGYKEGVVKDVIAEVIREHGPMHKNEIVEKVLRERYVKPNTVVVNLQDDCAFCRLDDGRYDILS